MFDNNEVDLITLEAGEGYFAGRYHSLRPIMAEKYDNGTSCTAPDTLVCYAYFMLIFILLL